MTRTDDIFDIAYSHNLEKMFSTITARLDKLITLAITVSGLGVFSFISGIAWFGALIATLSITQIIFQFSRASVISETQYRKYLKLSIEEPSLSDEQLRARRIAVEEVDTNPWSLLKPAAHKRACIQLGLDDTSDEMTLMQKCFSWLAGDLPRSKNTPEKNANSATK
ncbi:hypothetical protein CJP72_21870 [Citrobacter sp. NCU1]|nr:hypothetical protein [Citrobacter sp. NCU1]